MLFLLLFGGQDSLVNGSLSYNACSLIDLLTTVNQVFEIFGVASCSSVIQILKNTSNELVFSNFKRIFCCGSTCSIGSEFSEKSRLLEVTVVRSDMERSVMVLVLAVEHLLQQKLDLVLELLHNHVVVFWT